MLSYTPSYTKALENCGPVGCGRGMRHTCARGRVRVEAAGSPSRPRGQGATVVNSTVAKFPEFDGEISYQDGSNT